MYICDKGHDEVVHELARSCPACLMLREIEELTKERDSLQEEKEQHECKP